MKNNYITGFCAALAIALSGASNGQIKDVFFSQESNAYVQGSGRYFEAYPPGSAEGPGVWVNSSLSSRISDQFSKATLPPESWVFDQTVPAPNLNLFEWDGGVQPHVRHQFDVQQWVLSPSSNGHFSAMKFKFVISSNISPVSQYTFGSTRLSMAFETTERMKLVMNGVQLEMPGSQEVPPIPKFDRNGYLYPGRYMVNWNSHITDGTFELSLTLPPLDTDRDGISDEEETTVHNTNPNNPDTDGDGLRDEEEIFTHLTNPRAGDTDGDGFMDKFELQSGKSPTDPLAFPAAQLAILPAVELRIVTKLGSKYMIQASADLSSWEDTGMMVTGTGGEVVSVLQPVEGARKYWRVREVLVAQ